MVKRSPTKSPSLKDASHLIVNAFHAFMGWDIRVKCVALSMLVLIVATPAFLAQQHARGPERTRTAASPTTAHTTLVPSAAPTQANARTTIIGRTYPSGSVPGCLFEKADSPVSVAFCDTFDSPMGTGNRSGQLNGTVWGVSRATGNQNTGSPIDGWFPTQEQVCGQTVTAKPDDDVRICGGRLVEATTDGGTVTTLAMYPKQPFDISGRTGTVTFDVSDDSQGTHTAWPEFWYTDKPVPAPFAHESSWQSLPQDGVGIRFARACTPGQGLNCGPNCPADNAVPVVSVDSAVVVNHYVGNDSFSDGNLQVNGDSCVKEPTQPGQMNHFELRISQQQIDVYGTDAGTTSPLKHLATIPNANLTLTKGLIWLEDVHYNGDKMGTQGTHTFTWDNVGFDGPIHPRDAAYDTLDNTEANSDGSINLGWFVPPSSSQPVSVKNVTQASVSNATAALLTFNFWSEQTPDAFHFAVNGHPHDYKWPYPYSLSFSPMTIAIPVPLSDIQAGTNTVTFSTGANYALSVFNVDLIMVGGGGMPCSANPSHACSRTGTP